LTACQESPYGIENIHSVLAGRKVYAAVGKAKLKAAVGAGRRFMLSLSSIDGSDLSLDCDIKIRLAIVFHYQTT
jgi:hypothetical protein